MPQHSLLHICRVTMTLFVTTRHASACAGPQISLSSVKLFIPCLICMDEINSNTDNTDSQKPFYKQKHDLIRRNVMYTHTLS